MARYGSIHTDLDLPAGNFVRRNAGDTAFEAASDVMIDGDFASQGIMLRGATTGVYGIMTGSATVDTVEGTLTNDATHIPTSAAVYAAIGTAATYWSRAGTEVYPTTAGDSVAVYGDDINPGIFVVGKKHSTAIGADVPLGAVRFGGEDVDTAYSNWNAAAVVGVADTAWSSALDTPTRLEFYTTPDASGTAVERMTIEADGTVTINNSLEFPSEVNITNGGDLAYWADTTLHNIRIDQSANNSITGVYNITAGFGAGLALTTGTGNILVGRSAGSSLINDIHNLALGYNALMTYANNYGVAIGSYSLTNTTGTYNLGVGVYTLNANVTGQYNVAIGAFAGRYSAGSSNIFIGYNAGRGQSGLTSGNGNNVFIGLNTGGAITTGDGNIGFSTNTLTAITTGTGNIALGYSTLYRINIHDYNVAIGQYSQQYNVGDNNTCIGAFSGRGTDGVSTGTDNIFIGYGTGGDTTTGSYNLLVGYNLELTNPTDTYVLKIGTAGTELIVGSMTPTEWVGTSYAFRANTINEFTTDSGVTVEGIKLIDNYFIIPNITAPVTVPGAAEGYIYMDAADDKLYFKSSAATYDLTSGSVGVAWGTATVQQIVLGSSPGNIESSANFTYATATAVMKIEGGSGDLPEMYLRNAAGSHFRMHLTATSPPTGTIELPHASGKLVITAAGGTRLSNYGSGTITGTATYALNVDASGNIIEGAVGGTSVSFGSTTQIPYMNAGGTDFIYTASLTFDGNTFRNATANTFAAWADYPITLPTTRAYIAARDSTQYGVDDYNGIYINAKPSSGQNSYAVLACVAPVSGQHYSNFKLLLRDGNSTYRTVMTATYTSDIIWHSRLDTEDITHKFQQVGTVKAVLGWDDSGNGLQANYGTIFTTAPAWFIGSQNHLAVGSQTNHATYELHVTGDIYATGDITGNSDIRYKEVLGQVKFTWEDFMGITPIRYRSKLKEGSEPTFGFSSQNMMQHWNEPVTYDPESGRYGMKYNAIIPINTRAIQTLKTETELLKERVQELENQVAILKQSA